mgnify:CR=1 FL=1
MNRGQPRAWNLGWAAATYVNKTNFQTLYRNAGKSQETKKTERYSTRPKIHKMHEKINLKRPRFDVPRFLKCLLGHCFFILFPNGVISRKPIETVWCSTILLPLASHAPITLPFISNYFLKALVAYFWCQKTRNYDKKRHCWCLLGAVITSDLVKRVSVGAVAALASGILANVAVM